MAEDKYISDLSGEQLDAAFAKMAKIDQYVSQAAVSANGAQASASAASQSAAQASDSAATAGQQATAAAGSASNAADSAEQAQASASAAAQSAQKAAESATGMSDFVQQAQASARAAAQSASEAESSAGTAESAAQAAAGSEASVSANAEKAEQAATAAAASEAAAQNSAAQAAGSASDAAASAGLIQDNLDAIQAAPGAAQAAQQAASDAQAAQTAAEDAAERAEQIADFNPADFATAAQGAKADTAVQPDALDAYALKTDVPDTPADIGAATAAQGAKADTAVQSVNGAKPDSSGNVQLDLTTGTVRSVNGKDPDGSGNVQLSAGDVGAATAAQGALAATAVQPADLNGYAQTSDIPTELPNPQSLGIRLGSAGNLTAYDGSITRTITITPEAIGAQPAGAASGGEVTLIADTGMTSWSQAASYNSASLATGGYDMVGIVCLCNSSTASDEYSPIQWFPIPARGQSRKYGLFCMDVNNSPMGEAQVRMISITNNGSTIQFRSDTPGYYYNWGNKGQANTCAVPAFLYGMKF